MLKALLAKGSRRPTMSSPEASQLPPAGGDPKTAQPLAHGDGRSAALPTSLDSDYDHTTTSQPRFHGESAGFGSLMALHAHAHFTVIIVTVY